MPRLTAIVPATDSPPTLAACVAAIEGADEPPEEVFVIREGGAAPSMQCKLDERHDDATYGLRPTTLRVKRPWRRRFDHPVPSIPTLTT